MKKLKEVHVDGCGIGLGRIEDFDDDHADAILAGQEKTGVKLWELVPDESTSKKQKAVEAPTSTPAA
ncbi:hypothetical protein [Spirosoma litoris]